MKKILIVDDEQDVLEFLSYNFRKNEFDVSIATYGAEGLKIAENEHPDIIVADIMMPEMNGIEMSMEIRKNAIMNDIPILFLSAVHEDFQCLLTKHTLGDHYAAKPIKFENLLEIVNKIIEKKAS